ncbi:MAG TPA: c-type cytochrome [Usitatibacter sp.]|jgi:cytochrome c553|nr:c-type cytochrome [Usitatibacter sp.]
MQRAHRFAIGALAACSIAGAALAAESQPQDAQNARAAAGGSTWSAPLQNKIAQCQGCHGIEGWRTAFPEVYHVPKLGGQKPEYIIAALKEYKSGDRAFATMRAIASQLSDEDMEGIAKYYGAPATNTANAEKK